ncbi:YkgJ family cysteine cluster protein [uncultured Pseudodesulfovibrio sp.]|uniref:YkgJ family cysteine cluster protein n=1 Tax=uncultured Pseudodesulfovibrio sp. TaxID=2035858 RepID=UPI0029C84437|nr:YkgJ family cysteine cluster protein [uncultured Pseudodesulfovibrio sp.]
MFVLEFLTGLFRRWRFRILRRDVEVVGRCLCCGGCCRSIHLKDGGRWLRRSREFERMVADAPEHARFHPVGRGSRGFLLFDCFLLGPDNLCARHDTRPALCRNYPSKSLYYHGGRLPEDCGYAFRAVTFRKVLFGRKPLKPADFSAVLRREIQQDKDRQT